MSEKNLARRAWSLVKEPRFVSFLVWTQYLLATGVGAYALLVPPRSIEGQIGSLAMTLLASLLLLGGLIGSYAALPGKWYLEQVATIGVGAAAVIYLGVVLTLHIYGDGNHLVQAGFIYYAVVGCILRFYYIKDRPVRPEPITSWERV